MNRRTLLYQSIIFRSNLTLSVSPFASALPNMASEESSLLHEGGFGVAI